MTSLMNRAIATIIPMRRGEGRVGALMFAYSALAMAAHNILRPIVRSKFIEAWGADNVPYVLLAAGILIGVLMHVYILGIRRMPRRYVIPITQAGLVVLLVVFWGLLRTGAGWVPVAMYIFGSTLGILLISQFWTLANDVYDARQAKRVFGFIGAGASLGGMLGSALTTVVVEEIGANNLLLVSAGVLAGCAVVVMLILRHRPDAGTTDPFLEESGIRGREAFRLLAESRHLKLIALVIAFAAAGAAIIDQQLNMAAEAMKGPDGADSITAFLAKVNAYVSAAGFIVQIALTSRIHRSMGLAVALLLLPVGLGTTAAVILVSGTLWAPAIARVLDSTLRYTVDKTTREVLFLPLSAEVKYRAKPFLDVTVDRLAKATTALVMLLLIQPWGLGLDWRHLSYASLTVTGVWIVTALVARREYLASFRHSIGEHTIAPDAIRADVADAATIETLVEELSNPDESSVLYAIEMLEALDKRNLITPLLLQHESPRVRTRALLAVASSRSRVALRWTATVERMIQDVDVDVRAAALRALAALSQEDAASLMRRHVLDPEPRVAVAAAIVLANSNRAPDVDAADATLMRLIADTREAAAPGRLEAATALAHIADPRFRSLLVPLLNDPAIAVVEEAIRSARVMGASDGLFIPGLLSLLGHRALKGNARDALVSYGEPIVAALRHTLLDRDEYLWIRRHIPATLALIPTQASMDALVAALGDPDGFLRYKAIAAIERLRRDHPEIAFPRPIVERLVVAETSRYYNCLTLQYNLMEQSAEARSSLIGRALADKLQRTLDRIYRLLGLLHHVDDVAAARHTIEQGETRRRAAALEYLDNLLGGVVRRRVLPILDETPVVEKVRYANLVLKSRGRDVDDTLAQLVHEDDPVVAAAAIHFVSRRRLWALADDLEYVAAHRARGDRAVIEAASWALKAHREEDEPLRDFETEPLPAVELANRMRAIPLFEFLSVDELFRIAEEGEEVRYPAGRDLHRPGEPARDVEFIIEGAVLSTDAEGASHEIPAPCVVGLDEVLQGMPLTHTLRAIERVVCFRIGSGRFLTMVSDNLLLAEGLFRMLLPPHQVLESPPAHVPLHIPAGDPRLLPAQPIDKALLLRLHPLLARATVPQLLAVVSAAREISFAAGRAVFESGHPAALHLVLEGVLSLESHRGERVDAPAGSTIGLLETLSGAASAWGATAIGNVRVLRLERDDLFAVLADHVELMQGLFSGAIAGRTLEASAIASPVGSPSAAEPVRFPSQTI